MITGEPLTGRRQTDRFDDFGVGDRFPQLQQRYVVVIGVSIEAAVSDDGGDRAHDGGTLGGNRLVVITENNADF